MKKFVHLIAVIALAAAQLVLVAQSGNDLFQKALSKERAEGQLTEAIALYERIVNEFATDRPLAAKALLQMGRCYERLGKSEAQKTYDRLLREYADQRAVADEARARLAALERTAAAPVRAPGSSAGIVTRQVWTGPKVDILGSVSQDGRYLSFAHWDTGDLGLHDFVTGKDRLLTNNGPKPIREYAEESVISRDGKQVAYSWYNGKFRYELRTVSLSTGATAPPRRLYDNEDVDWMGPHDWSPDGQSIAVQITRRDRTTQIGLVASKDGALRVLKSMGWRGPAKMFFSPDGKYLAFDLPLVESSHQRDVFVLAVDGSRETAAVVHPANDIVVGWSLDGSRLLFSSDRTGAVGLWSLAMAGGKPRGTAELIKPEIGTAWSLGLASSGALYLGSRVGGLDIQVASIDFSTGRLLSPPVNPIPDHVGSNTVPQWSPDGKRLAYVSRRDVGSRHPLIGIRSMETGQVRELRPNLNNLSYGLAPEWSPDGRFFAVEGTDLKGREGIFRIDAQTGDASPIVLSQGEFLNGAKWSPDGRKIYYRRSIPGTSDPTFVERDLVSGAEREVFRRRGMGAVTLSPDGRWIATRSQDESARFSTLIVVPVGSGEPRELFRVQMPSYLIYPSWAPDASFVIACKVTLPDSDRCEHWQIPLAGGEPGKLGVDLKMSRRNGWISVHPDGRQLAYAAGHNQYEVSVMENFLPLPSATTSAPAKR